MEVSICSVGLNRMKPRRENCPKNMVQPEIEKHSTRMKLIVVANINIAQWIKRDEKRSTGGKVIMGIRS